MLAHDDAQDFQPGYLSGIARCLPLRIIEISRAIITAW